jgi:hypothetical protein
LGLTWKGTERGREREREKEHKKEKEREKERNKENFVSDGDRLRNIDRNSFLFWKF